MKNQNGRPRNYNQSALMSAYNYCKWWGRRTGLTTDKRCDKALSYIKKGEAQAKLDEYQTSMKYCGCEDKKYRPWFFCNHQDIHMITIKHDEIMIDEGYWKEAA